MEKKFFVSFFSLGLISIISQGIILREFLINFYGNEFFIGILLAGWLLSVSLGSLAFGKILKKLKNFPELVDYLQVLILFLLFLEVLFIRYLRGIFWQSEIPNLIYSALTGLLLPLPLCFLLGAWWTLASNYFYERNKERGAFLVNFAYFLECLGFIVGGILFNLFLVKLNSLKAVIFFGILNLSLIIFFSLSKKSLKLKSLFVFLLLFFLFFYFSPFLKKVEDWSIALKFKDQVLIESKNTLYGNITILKKDSQYNFYEDGVYFGSEKDYEFAENFVHLALLSHNLPEKVLLIGGGATGFLREILKHPVKDVYYLELDPELITISKNFLSQEQRNYLSDKRVKIINLDAIYFLKTTDQKFDLILVNLPNPSTALINRFYSKEFFQLIKEKLKEDGIFVDSLAYSSSGLNKNLKKLLTLHFKTLATIFPKVVALPEDEIFFFAFNKENVNFGSELLIKRFEERKIKTNFFNENYINYRLSNDRVLKFQEILAKEKNIKINQNFLPVSYFYQTLFWLDMFSKRISLFLEKTAFSFFAITLTILVFFASFLIFKKKEFDKKLPYLATLVSGFSLMSLETIIIFVYQAIVGYLYFKITLLISFLMTGLGLGVILENKKIEKSNLETFSLFKPHFRIAIFAILLIPLFYILNKIPSLFFIEFCLLLVGFLAGFLSGFIFPLSNKIYLDFKQENTEETSLIYSADLLGSSLGAIIPSLIIIPAFGVFTNLFFISFLNLWLIFLLFLAKNLGGKSV